eukprot:5104094-Prymnesium_polylepis.1
MIGSTYFTAPLLAARSFGRPCAALPLQRLVQADHAAAPHGQVQHARHRAAVQPRQAVAAEQRGGVGGQRRPGAAVQLVADLEGVERVGGERRARGRPRGRGKRLHDLGRSSRARRELGARAAIRAPPHGAPR